MASSNNGSANALVNLPESRLKKLKSFDISTPRRRKKRWRGCQYFGFPSLHDLSGMLEISRRGRIRQPATHQGLWVDYGWSQPEYRFVAYSGKGVQEIGFHQVVRIEFLVLKKVVPRQMLANVVGIQVHPQQRGPKVYHSCAQRQRRGYGIGRSICAFGQQFLTCRVALGL